MLGGAEEAGGAGPPRVRFFRRNGEKVLIGRTKPPGGDSQGENVNRIIPGGHDHMEPASGQSIMLAHRVQVEKTEAPAGRGR